MWHNTLKTASCNIFCPYSLNLKNKSRATHRYRQAAAILDIFTASLFTNLSFRFAE